MSTAKASNSLAAAAGLWDALDTVRCGHPEIVSGFLAPLAPYGDVVDIGCWNGSIAELAAGCVQDGEWRSYVGVDVVEAAVERFNERHADRARTNAVVGDIRALPLPDGCADVVLCLFVLQDMEGYRPDGLQALREIARIARPGASVLLGLTVHTLREENTHYVVKKLRPAGIPEKPTHHWHGPELLAALRANGFEITHIDAFGPNERGFVELYVQAIAGSPRGQAKRTVRTALVPSAPPLFIDYVDRFEHVGSLFRHDFRDPSSFERAGAAAAARDLPRGAVADVLQDQHATFGGSDSAARNIERLRDPDAVAVLTGQQPALFGGPLYNLYKAATAVLLARRLEATTGRPHVPVFWIANDDHSLDAVDHVQAVTADGTVAPITWEHGRTRSTEPLSLVRLDQGIETALDLLSRVSTSPRVTLAAETFRAGERLSDCFGRFLAAAFADDGLVVVDPSDGRLRELGMPRLAAELDYPAPSATAARTPTEWLEGQGYPPQVALRADRLGLFHGETARFRLRASELGCQMSFGTAPVAWSAARATFEATPREFSPNVVLRPIYQDALFPTAAYVGGPSEISYFAQLAPVYARFGLPMPVIYPRKSVTLVNARAERELDARGLSVEDVFRDTAALGPHAFANTDQRWLHAFLAPDGAPQERVIGAACMPTARALSSLSLDVFDHQVIRIRDRG
ncbi:MAG TPA: bacillithiol biosynthesis cysteine-adding enzyme BshC [Candidatus Limnocylindrales bacterium]|nr:bacillithiol biosynthesis cysteine-adding enzyme BshC [Candidatus Limnocylindrales bacterium]